MRRVCILAAGLLLGGCKQDTEVHALTPEIAVAPDAIDFGEQAVPVEITETLYITNGGRARLDVTVSLSDGDPDAFWVDVPETQIAAGDTWMLPVHFQPDTYLLFDATLRFESNDLDTPLVEIPLTGLGVSAPLPDIAVDPPALDFGTVAAGSATMAFLMIENHGDAPLTLGTITQAGSGAIVMTTDPSGSLVGPGDELPVLLTYTPVSEGGDNGLLTIPSDDPDEPELEVVILGNGGGAFDYPEAIIDCPGTSEPPEVVEFDGSQSTDPTGNYPLIYAWSLPQQPNGSHSELTNLTSDSTSLFTDVAGTYEIQLVVTNQVGISSVPDKCTIHAVPADDLHIELTWDTPRADLDLHVLEDGAALFESPGDCTWCNATPSWGSAGTDDDPRLDIDDRGGHGPENINLGDPADGIYFIKVHYFEEHGDDAVTATIRLYAYGVLELERSRIIHRNEVWDVAQLNWPASTVGVQSTELWDATTRSCD